MDSKKTRKLGAVLTPHGVEFTVWASHSRHVDVCIVHGDQPDQRTYHAMKAVDYGYFMLDLPDVGAGTRYLYRLDGQRELPDPASRCQPDGVHGASQVIDPAFAWTDQAWRVPALRDHIFYELHVGAFSPEGTFDGVIKQIPRLCELGVTMLELMPVAQFPGSRNWGYDGVYPFSTHIAYGGVDGLRRLVDACHTNGLGVTLDMVYNHIGPEGNYFGAYAPYFTGHYLGPWGAAMNFDGGGSDEVRRYFIENALYWFEVCHIDALRLDASDHLLDFSAVPFLDELVASVDEWESAHHRRVYLIAENDRSDVKLTRPQSAGGAGLDAQWLDDLHHCLHTLLTKDSRGYYEDYHPPFAQLIRCLRDGFVYSGQYSRNRQRRHGTPSRGTPGDKFVVCTQNHDQVGNRPGGERLLTMTDVDSVKLAAGLMLLSPYVPLLFMGEEYGESAPFQYFISHTDPDLVRAVQEGRRREFGAFHNHSGQPIEIPDPASEATFQRCKLNPEQRHDGVHNDLYRFYRALIDLRKTCEPLQNPDRRDIDVWGHDQILFMHRRTSVNRSLADGGMGVTSSPGKGTPTEAYIVFNLDTENAVTFKLSPPLLADNTKWQLNFTSHPDLDTILGSAPEFNADTEITLPAKAFMVLVEG